MALPEAMPTGPVVRPYTSDYMFQYIRIFEIIAKTGIPWIRNGGHAKGVLEARRRRSGGYCDGSNPRHNGGIAFASGNIQKLRGNTACNGNDRLWRLRPKLLEWMQTPRACERWKARSD